MPQKYIGDLWYNRYGTLGKNLNTGLQKQSYLSKGTIKAFSLLSTSRGWIPYFSPISLLSCNVAWEKETNINIEFELLLTFHILWRKILHDHTTWGRREEIRRFCCYWNIMYLETLWYCREFEYFLSYNLLNNQIILRKLNIISNYFK